MNFHFENLDRADTLSIQLFSKNFLTSQIQPVFASVAYQFVHDHPFPPLITARRTRPEASQRPVARNTAEKSICDVLTKLLAVLQ